MIRSRFDLPAADIARLDAIAQREGQSGTAVMPDAVAQYRAILEQSQ